MPATRTGPCWRHPSLVRRLNLDAEAVPLEVEPPRAPDPARRATRGAIAEVRGPKQADEADEADEWTPHISVGHSNSAGLKDPFQEAASPLLEPAAAEISEVELIVQGRDQRLYKW
jgi:hypothetical protein